MISTAGKPLAVHTKLTESVSLTDMAVGSRGDKISAGAVEERELRLINSNISRQKFILGLIYFQISGFKDLGTVATVPDHQQCWHWDSFRYLKLF